jgi:bacteriorhodopsin
MFPILFILGQEGFGHITHYGSSLGHSILELFSKNLVSGVCGTSTPDIEGCRAAFSLSLSS